MYQYVMIVRLQKVCAKTCGKCLENNKELTALHSNTIHIYSFLLILDTLQALKKMPRRVQN